VARSGLDLDGRTQAEPPQAAPKRQASGASASPIQRRRPMSYSRGVGAMPIVLTGGGGAVVQSAIPRCTVLGRGSRAAPPRPLAPGGSGFFDGAVSCAMAWIGPVIRTLASSSLAS
jgi:hypothetical protein